MVQYWDTKGQGYESVSYDYPSGTFAWDVTDLVSGSGTYTATITNADLSPTNGSSAQESFTTYGFGLLVVYDLEEDDPDASLQSYAIFEGADILKGDGYYEEPADATTNAFFDRVQKVRKMQNAELTTVVVSCDKPDLNMVYFNGEELGPCNATSDKAIGVDSYDVTSLVKNKGNIVEIQDRGDYMVASNAFLVVEY